MTTRNLLLLISLGVGPVVAFDECCLCDPLSRSPNDNLPWDSSCWNHPDKSEKWIGLGYQCADASVDAFDYMSWDNECSDYRSQWAQKCCTRSSRFDFEEVEQPPPTRPPITLTQGIWQECDLCFNKQFPGKPYTITSVQYVDGNPTCSDLFWMGKFGHIEDDMCYPLTIWMQEPCGCDMDPFPGYVAPTAPVSQAATSPTHSPTYSPSKSPGTGPTLPQRKERSDYRDRSLLKLSVGRQRGVMPSTRSLEGVRGEEGEGLAEETLNPMLEPMEIVEVVLSQRAESVSDKEAPGS